MLNREFKINFKSFIIWFAILAGMFVFVYFLYPFIITEETMQSMDELMKVLPEEVLKTFNMDMASISTAYGWVKSEGLVYLLLCIGLYASILGGNILLKEEKEKTIEYLHSLPIKRSTIMTQKILVSLIYIIGMVLFIGIINYIGLLLSGDFIQKEFILLSISPLMIALPLFAFNLFISTCITGNKKTLGISLGMVFIFYLLSILSELSSKVEFLKYLSIYTLADTRNIIDSCSYNILYIIISIFITVVFISLSYFKYQKKELI